jgi:hypothetical protein
MASRSSTNSQPSTMSPSAVANPSYHPVPHPAAPFKSFQWVPPCLTEAVINLQILLPLLPRRALATHQPSLALDWDVDSSGHLLAAAVRARWKSRSGAAHRRPCSCTQARPPARPRSASARQLAFARSRSRLRVCVGRSLFRREEPTRNIQGASMRLSGPDADTHSILSSPFAATSACCGRW